MGRVRSAFIMRTGLSFLVGCLACVVAGQDFDPFTPGPYEVNRKSYYPFFNAELEYELTVWVPDSKGAPLTTPLIYMVGGLGGLMPGIGYDTIFKRVASHGFTILQPWVLG